MRSIGVLVLLVWISFNGVSQNNAIFSGGNSNTGNIYCYVQPDAVLNNPIFNGGFASGADVYCYTQPDAVLNNSIFGGGFASGADVYCFTQLDVTLNNSIFGGGNASGSDVYCYMQLDVLLNNSIFSGGISSGATTFCQGNVEEIPLPISMLFFNAKPEDNIVSLTWATTSESNNDFFTIERSSNGIHWDIRSTVFSTYNTSSSIIHYQTSDQNPIKGISYYRLKQTDFSGKYAYSNIVTVDFNDISEGIDLALYPNPSNGILHLVTNKEHYTIEIRNTIGQLILTAESPKEIDLSSLADGAYFIHASSENSLPVTLKLVLRK